MSRRTALFALGLSLFVSPMFRQGGQVAISATLPPLANVQVNEPRPGDTAAETTTAADPTNPKHLVVAWIELFPTPVLTSVIGYASSKDAGGSWQTAFLDIPEFQAAFDPSLVVDSSGNFYLA